MILLIMAALSAPSYATVRPKAPRAQEIYEATEAEGDTMPAVRVVARQAPGIAQPHEQLKQTLPQPAAVANVAAPAKLPDSGLAYDPVPSDQIDALGRRLQLTDALIRRHGRAYDYRTHTVRDLELILAKLDASLTSSR
jgi:hypothetical protein